jgi:hypothetical protein
VGGRLPAYEALYGLDRPRAFTASALAAILEGRRFSRAAPDAEVLFLAERRGYRIARVPLQFRIPTLGSPGILRRMAVLFSFLKMRLNFLRGKYEEEEDTNLTFR